MLLRSRIVLPVTAPPVEDGAVLISGERLVAVGRWADLRRHVTGPVLDLQEVILFPGLINGHCHLDYTGFAGHLPAPRVFTDWLQGVVALKAQWSFSEFAASWLEGARQLLDSGCTAVFDIEAVPELQPEAWESTPLRVVSAFEMTGIRSARSPEVIIDEALGWIARLSHPRNRGALAPHAPYSTKPALLRLSATAARQRGLLISLHLAESRDEFDMFRHARGPMFEWLRGQRDVTDCGWVSPVRYVAEAGILGENCVLVHVNHLDEDDAALLGAARTSVVHCPRSHEYFGRDPFPLKALTDARVNVCLGTDSLLSVRRLGRTVPRLDMFAEMRTAARLFPGLKASEILAMSTVAPARALGRPGEIGELRDGALADLVAVPFGGRPESASDELVQTAPKVIGSMIGGVWAIAPAAWTMRAIT